MKIVQNAKNKKIAQVLRKFCYNEVKIDEIIRQDSRST